MSTFNPKYLFNPKYICYTWDDSLKGKEVWYGDSVSSLEDGVQSMNPLRGTVVGHTVDDNERPFIVKGINDLSSRWRYVYYDPNYDIKVAYYKRHKQVQYRKANGQWENVAVPVWSENDVYRVKPEEQNSEHAVQATEFPSLCGYCIHRKDGCMPEPAGKCVNFFSTNDDYFRVKKDYVDLVKEHVELERKYCALVSGIQQLIHGPVNC